MKKFNGRQTSLSKLPQDDLEEKSADTNDKICDVCGENHWKKKEVEDE